MDALVEVPREEWPSLISHFKGHEGLTARTCLRAQTYEKDKNEDLFHNKVYAPYGEREEGLLIIWKLIEGAREICVYSAKENPTRLMEALRETKLIDWEMPKLFACVMPNFHQPMADLLDELKVNYGGDDTVIAHLPAEKVKSFEFEVPDDVKLKVIGPEFALEIDNHWPFRYPGSDKYFEGMLDRGAGLGLVGKDNELRAWIFTSCRGDLHSLCVKPDHRRKGYAQLIIKAISKEIIKRNNEIYGCIVTKNEPSKKLFQGLGFELLWVVRWFSCVHH